LSRVVAKEELVKSDSLTQHGIEEAYDREGLKIKNF